MSQRPTITAQKRERRGTTLIRQMRKEGLVPAIVYGAKQENIKLKVNETKFAELLRGSQSENILLNLDIEGETKLALVQEVQHHAIKDSILHIDFHAVSETENVHTHVTIELVGESKGMKEGGILDQQLHSIEVHCLPADLPEVLQADITELGLNEAFHVKNLALPKGVEISLDPEAVIALISEPRVADKEEEAESTEQKEPEKIGEKEKEEAKE